MLRIIGSLFETPEISLHGLFAIRLILLSGESGLVSGDLHEVFRTSGYSCCHRREAVTNTRLVGTQRSGAFVTLGAKRINALSIPATPTVITAILFCPFLFVSAFFVTDG